MSWAAPLMFAAALAARPPEARQTLIDLAYVLGEVHALRQVCSGPTDQTWRARMNRMVELEKPDAGLNRRLVDAFNAGFMTRQAERPVCDDAALDAERATAQTGRGLSEKLAGIAP